MTTTMMTPSTRRESSRRRISSRISKTAEQLPTGIDFYDHGYFDDSDDDDEQNNNNNNNKKELLPSCAAYGGGMDNANEQQEENHDNDDGFIERLDFTKVKFHGRTRELQHLKQVYHQLMEVSSSSSSSSSSSPVVLLSGYSGTGKSTLIHQFIQTLRRQNDRKTFHFLSGKYSNEGGGGGGILSGTRSRSSGTAATAGGSSTVDGAKNSRSSGGGGGDFGSSNPFSAIIDALNEFMSDMNRNHQELQQSQEEEDESSSSQKKNDDKQRIMIRNQIETNLKNAMGPEEAQVLLRVVPALESLFVPHTTTQGTDTSSTGMSFQDDEKDATMETFKADQRSAQRRGDAVAATTATATGSSVATVPPTIGGTTTAGDDRLWKSLLYSFRTFLEALCTEECPVILFLDDLQWADQASMDLLTTLLTDPALKHFMFLGTHRPPIIATTSSSPSSATTTTTITETFTSVPNTGSHNQHPTQHNDSSYSPGFQPFLSTLDRIKKRQDHYDERGGGDATTDCISQQQQPCTLHRIELLNLTISELGNYIGDCMDRYPEDIIPLTEAIHGKTRGNIFYAIQLLQELQRKEVFYYCRIGFQWEWKHLTSAVPTSSRRKDNINNSNTIELKDESKHVEEEEAITTTDNNNNKYWAKLFEGLSENEMDAVVARIRWAPEVLQMVLVVAAYTRSTFTVDILLPLVETISEHSYLLRLGLSSDQARSSSSSSSSSPLMFRTHNQQQTREELVRILDTAVFEGLLSNRVGSQSYSFCHDRIQHAAFSLVPEGPDRMDLRWRLGKRLYEIYTTTRADGSASVEEWVLFTAGEHLNSSSSSSSSLLVEKRDQTVTGPEQEKQNSLFLAKLNVEVGEAASSVAAFDTAAKYLRRGLDELHRGTSNCCWENEYDLSLRLHQDLANAEFCIGNVEQSSELGKQVLEHAKTMKAKVPTYLSLCKILSNKDLQLQALDLNRTALLLLKEYPRRGYLPNVVKYLIYVKRFLKKYSDKEILELPLMKDESKVAAMTLLTEASLRAFTCENILEFMLTTLRLVRSSFKHGICGDTSFGLMTFALLLGGSGDQIGALRVARLAQKVLARTGAKHLEGWVLLGKAGFIDSWSEPMEDVLMQMRKGHNSGMLTGDYENASMNLNAWCIYSFVSGLPLGYLDGEINHFVDELRLYNVEKVVNAALEVHWPIPFLRGTAEAINWKRVAEFGWESTGPNDKFQLLLGYLGRLQLAVYFGEYVIAGRLAAKLPFIKKMDNTYMVVSLRTFFSALAASGLAREVPTSRSRYKYKTMWKKNTNELKHMLQTRGGKNQTRHRVLLLEADWMGTCQQNGSKRYSFHQIQEAYDEAIKTAVDTAHPQDAALGSELAAHYCSRTGENGSSRKYLDQAIQYYNEWGAIAKVRDLQSRSINKYQRRNGPEEGTVTTGRDGEDLCVQIQ